jgi:hypothetical protein
VKKMNGHTLEIEQGTVGYARFDASTMNRAIKAWVKRRGLKWDNPYRKPPLEKMKRTP